MLSLLADVGGTYTSCALLREHEIITKTVRLHNDDFANLVQLLRNYLAEHLSQTSLDCVAVAVAGPVAGDDVRLTNRDWCFSVSRLADELSVNDILVVNDFSAQAASLPFLGEEDLLQVGGGSVAREFAKVVIGPGTGLGVSGVIPKNAGWAVIKGEGGNVTLPACTGREIEILAEMRKDYSDCAAESIVSGLGIARLYKTLRSMAGEDSLEIASDEIFARAEGGEPLAVETRALFFDFLGTLASNLALTLGAMGGVYLSGGVLTANPELLLNSGFRNRFEDKGRFKTYMESIPTFLIEAKTPAMTGLKALLSGRI